jgi:hypothetical protein
MVGIAHEVTVGEEQQLDDIPAQIARAWGRRLGVGATRSGLRRCPSEIYVSHVDISWVQCYKTAGYRETLDRFAPAELQAA